MVYRVHYERKKNEHQDVSHAHGSRATPEKQGAGTYLHDESCWHERETWLTMATELSSLGDVMPVMSSAEMSGRNRARV